MLNIQARKSEHEEARSMLDSLAGEFKIIMGSQKNLQAVPNAEVKSVKLADYLKQRSTSSKRTRVSVLPEDDSSMLFRKKRDEIMKIIDRSVKMLQQVKSFIIERSDLNTLITHEIKIREIADAANYCRIAFRNSINVVTQYDIQPPQITDKQQQEIKHTMQKIKSPKHIDTIASKVSSPTKDITELKNIISYGFKSHTNEKQTSNLRNKASMKQSSGASENDIIQSRIMSHDQQNSKSLKRNEFENTTKLRAPTILELKQSLYQPEPMKTISHIPVPQAPLKRSLTISIKDSNFNLLRKD